MINHLDQKQRKAESVIAAYKLETSTEDVRIGTEGKTHREMLLVGSGSGSGLASSLLKTYCYYFLLGVRVSLCVYAYLSTVPLEARRGHQLP